jgi:hypothetical protein
MTQTQFNRQSHWKVAGFLAIENPSDAIAGSCLASRILDVGNVTVMIALGRYPPPTLA